MNRRARRRAGLRKTRAAKGGKISHSEMKTASKDEPEEDEEDEPEDEEEETEDEEEEREDEEDEEEQVK